MPVEEILSVLWVLVCTVAVLALLRPRLEPVLDAKEGKA